MQQMPHCYLKGMQKQTAKQVTGHSMFAGSTPEAVSGTHLHIAEQ